MNTIFRGSLFISKWPLAFSTWIVINFFNNNNDNNDVLRILEIRFIFFYSFRRDRSCPFRSEMPFGQKGSLDLQKSIILVLLSQGSQRSDLSFFSSFRSFSWRWRPLGFHTYVYHSFPYVLRIPKITLFWKLDTY